MKNVLTETIAVALILGVLTLVLPIACNAQGTGATLEGTIRDASGAVIPGARVIITNTDTGIDRTVVTNQDGFYSAPALTPGKYSINASAAGFQGLVVNNVVLTVGAQEVANLQMIVGQLGQTVEVVGAAPDIDLASSMVSHVVGETAIQELPLNGRDWTQLAQLQPGVAVMVSQDTATADRLQRGNGTQLTISGGRPSENNFRVNGVSVNDYANTAPATSVGTNLGVDAILEFSTLVGSFSAEYGRSSGGIVNAITRSGTNAIHGSAYYFVRNSAFDARNFFDATPSAHAFRRNQFGGAMGGPIKKNRTFYFVDYEGLLSTLGVSGVGVVPSANARNGILSSGSVTVSPIVKPYLAIFPLPNGPLAANGDTGTYYFDAPQKAHDNYITGKVDQRFSDADNVSFSYYSDAALFNTPDELANKFITFGSHNQSASAEWSHIFSPSLLNTFRAGFSRAVATQGLDLDIVNPALKDLSLGFSVPAQGPAALVVGGLTSITGGLNAYGDTAFWFTTLQAYDNVLLTRGIHSLKLGFSFERDRSNSIEATNAQFTFGSVQTFLQGNPINYNATLPGSNYERGVRQSIVGAYAQDDVRIRPNLTLNLGVRYEMATVPSEVNGLLAGLSSLTAPKTTVFNGAAGPIFNNPTLRNFEPRVGFAWDPFKDGKTSVRGGFAIFDVLPLAYLFVNQFTRTPPFYLAGTLQTSNIPNVFPAGAYNLLTPATNRTVLIEHDPRRPYKTERNFTIQRQLIKGTTLSVGYVGANGVHLPVLDQDVDLVLPISTNPYRWAVPTTSAQRVNPNFGRIGTTRWYGYSLYNGLQTTLTGSYHNSLLFRASYTWSKSMDNDTATFSNNEFLNGIGNPYPFDPNFNKGLSDVNIAHNFIFSETWLLPSPKQSSLRWLIGGWELGNIFQVRTGAPFTPLLNASQSGSQSSSAQNALGERPNFVDTPACADPTTGNPNAFYNVKCFTFPAAGTLGNLGRNTLTGPGFVNLDSSLFRNFKVSKISEQFRAQLRMEFFNVLNHPNFGMLVGRTGAVAFNSNGTPNSSAGLITATQNPSRQMQFALKLIW